MTFFCKLKYFLQLRQGNIVKWFFPPLNTVFILNKNYQQHLTDDYKETEDLLRLMVKPVENKLVQRLTYKVNKTGDGTGTISMEWEKIKIDIPFKTLQ